MPTRREFRVGEIIGNGWTVISPERVPIRLSTGRLYQGIRVRCHCGTPFVVSITNVQQQLGCGCQRGKNRVQSQTPHEIRRRRRRAIQRLEPMCAEFEAAVRIDTGYTIDILRSYWAMKERSDRVREWWEDQRAV